MSTCILESKLKNRILKDTGLDACIDLNNNDEQWLWRLCMTAAAFRAQYALFDYEVQVDSQCPDEFRSGRVGDGDDRAGGQAGGSGQVGGNGYAGDAGGDAREDDPQLPGTSARHFKSVIRDTVSNILHCCSISGESTDGQNSDDERREDMFNQYPKDHIADFIDRVYGACGYHLSSGHRRISPPFSSAAVAGITIIRGGIRPYKMYFSGLAPLTMSDDTARTADDEHVRKLLARQGGGDAAAAGSGGGCAAAAAAGSSTEGGAEQVRRMFCLAPPLPEVAEQLHEILDSADASPIENLENFVFLHTGKNMGWGPMRSLDGCTRKAPAAAYLKKDKDIEEFRKYCLCFAENGQNLFVPVPEFMLQMHNLPDYQDILLPVNALMNEQGLRPAFKVTVHESGCELHSNMPLPAGDRCLFYLLAWSYQKYSLSDHYTDGNLRPVRGFMTHAAMIFFYHVMTYAGYRFELTQSTA